LDAAGWKTVAAAGTAASSSAESAVGGTSGSPAHGDDAVPGAAPGLVGARAKDGKTLSLTLVTRTGSALDTQVAGLISSQLESAGIAVRTKAVSAATLIPGYVAKGDYDLALFSWPASRYPVADEAAIYAKPQVAADGAIVDGANLSGVGTDEIDRLMQEASLSLDPAAAAKLTNEADTRIWQAAPSLPLFQDPELVATRDTVANAGAFGLSTVRFQDLGFKQ
jgi:peptide/nickel transport system substrate-binding protein